MTATDSFIDLRRVTMCPRYHARLTWQQLFNHYRNLGGDLDHMDSILCDLLHLTKLYTEDTSVEFGWGLHGRDATEFELLDYWPNKQARMFNPDLVIVRYSRPEQFIRFDFP